MPLVRYTEMPSYQQHCVREIYSDWTPEECADFAFWVRKDGQLAMRRAGRHQMTDEAAKRYSFSFVRD